MRTCLLMVVMVLAAMLTGCSSFDRDFAEAQRQPMRSANSLAGAWSGEWQSGKGHGGGALKAIITPAEAPSTATGATPQKYNARFHATWAKVLTGEYTVVMTGTPGTGETTFVGSKDLGKMAGGLYHYKGHVKGDVFYSTYKSDGDEGTFTMRRVTAK